MSTLVQLLYFKSLNTLQFHNCHEPTMAPEYDSFNCDRAHDFSKYNIIKTRGFHVVPLNIKSTLTKINEIRFIVKQSNSSITEIQTRGIYFKQ